MTALRPKTVFAEPAGPEISNLGLSTTCLKSSFWRCVASSMSDSDSSRMCRGVILTEWADAVLFATRKIITKTEEGGFGRERTIAAGLGKDGGERILRTVGSPACVAKNRYGLPAELPLSWPALMQALAAGLPAEAAQAKPISASGTVPARGTETNNKE